MERKQLESRESLIKLVKKAIELLCEKNISSIVILSSYKISSVLKESYGVNIKVDKIMIFTDCQMWSSYQDGAHIRKEWNAYKKKYPNVKIYLFDFIEFIQVMTAAWDWTSALDN